MAKNLFLQSPDAGDIQDVFAKGADALTSAAMPAPSAEPEPKQAAPAPQNSTPRRPAPTAEDIARRATELGIDPALPLAIWGVESGSNFNSRDSYKGAAGGMQVMPDTYKMVMGSYSGQRDPWNNMEAGLRYIAYGQKTLGTKDPALLAAGYHAGYDRKDLKAGQIPQNIGDGLMKTKDYAAKVAGKVGLGGTPTAGGTPNLQQQLDQEEPGRYQVLSDDEAAAIQRKTLQSSLDGEEEGRYQVLSPSEVSAYETAAQPPKQAGGIGSTLADIGKMGLGGVYKGVGQVIGGVGEAVAMVGDYTTTPVINALAGTNYRTGNLLKTPADWYKEGGERAQGSISKESLEAVKNSSPDGDLFKPSTWTFGKAPSLRGYAMLGADVLGSMAPVVAASVASGGSAVVGGVVGGAQGGGAAASTARDTIEKMAKDGTIADQSAYYRELIAAGKSPQEAAQLTQDAAAQWALLLTAPVSAAGGALTSKIVDPASKIVAGGNLPARIAGRAGIGGLEEGAQEATETVQTQSGINKGAGTNLNVTDGTFGDFVLGALGGATTGAGAGALSSRDANTTTQQTEQPAQARQEPAMDAPQAAPEAATQPEAAAQPAPSGPIGRAIEKASPAAPVQEAAPAPQATAAPELPRVTITAEDGQTMTGFAEQIGEDGSGRVLGDDGQTYQFTAADGVTITVEGQAKAPREDVEEQTAATETEAASAQPEPEAAASAAETDAEQANAAPETEAQGGAQNEQKASQVVENNENDAGAEKPLAERTEEELRERLRYLTQQAKISGWDGRLVKERGRVSREINRRNSEGRNDRNTTSDNGLPGAVVAEGDQVAATAQQDQQTGRAPTEVVDKRPSAEARSSSESAGAGTPDVSGTDGAADAKPALEPTNSLQRTASWVVREKDTGKVVMETFDKKKVDALNTEKYEAVPVQQHLGELNAAIKAGDSERDAHAGKWFGSEEKAAAYVSKKKITDTHEVVKTGKVRFEVKPKAEPNATPASVEKAPAAINSDATSADADLDAMFDDAVAAKKQADAKPEAAATPVEQSPKAKKPSKAAQNKEKIAQVSATHLGGATAGDTITASKDFDYVTGGKPMVIESISPKGEVHVHDPVGGGRTSFRAGDATARQVTFEVAKRAEVPAKKAAPAKTEGAKAAESLTSAAKNTAAGLTAAIDGLGELFGGAGKLNSGLTFDEETYAKAKPLFKQAIAHLGDAGSDLKQAMQAIVNMVMDKFGEETTQRMKPYVVRFVADVRDGKEQTDEAAAKPAEGQALENATAPEHVQIGVDDRELGQIAQEFKDAQQDMLDGDHPVSNVFAHPKKSEIVRLNDKAKVYHKDHGWMTPAEAKAKIAEWKAHAQAQGQDPAMRSANSEKVVLSLFDLSGEWSKPWAEAGYQVFRFDIQADPDMGDVNNFSTEFFSEWFGDFDGMDIHAILAACPCTDFAVSGARHFAAKDADGRTVASVKLVHQTLAAIEYFKPAVWALENPVGRIESLTGLPNWRLSFDPNHLGDPYTKKTLIWGRFNGDLPIAPVEPTEGSKMHTQYGGKSQATKNARSVTPEGFSYGFFMANNAIDHPAMTVANKFDRLDSALIGKAIDAGVTPEQIEHAVEDFYYMDLDDDAANDAIRDLIPGGAPDNGKPSAAGSGSEIEPSAPKLKQGETQGSLFKARAAALAKQFAKAKEGQMALNVEAAVMPDGSDGFRFHAVDKGGQKVGKTQLVRGSLPDSQIEELIQRFAQDMATANARLKKPKTPRSEVVKGVEDATSTGNGVERRGSQPATEPVLADSDGDAARAVRPSDSDGGRASREADAGQQGDTGVSTDRAPANGDASLVGVHRGDGAAEFASVATGSEFGERGSDSGVERVQTAADAAEAARAVADSRAKQQERKRAQRAADSVKSAPGIDNIRETLPTLLPGQQEDVAKTEARFSKPDGYGMLLTNGTGTGKTYSGLGVAKRFARDGKANILMVVPDDKVGADWEASAADLLLDASVLPDTKSAGQGVVITTYAGLAQNNALASRDWDLVIPDEAHKLMQSADGSTTAALQNLRALTLHPDGAYARYQMQNAADIERLQNMIAKQQANEKPDPVLANKIDALDAKLTEARKAVQADVAARQGEKRPRVLFLSATPFAYEKTVDWAQGYLFEYPKAEGSGYNSGNGHQQFMMQHFGYTMRYNKLTEPDAKVDRGLMQRNFNTWLKREGALSGRTLDVDQDYDRRFVLIDSKVGNRIDEAFSWIDEKRRAASGEDARVWGELSKGLHDTFDYLSRRYLLEAIKAKESIPWVKGQLALGRKGVVYHDYKKGGGFNPFATFANAQPSANLTQTEQARFSEHMGEFRKAFDDLVAADWAAYGSAISTYREAFGDNVLVVNGDEKSRDNLARYKKFQDDSTGPQVILVQSAKNAGWSGHDTTGKYQRFLLNLGLPTAPTMAIQQEGRIYRTGQASDAIMRYMNTGTSWEKQAFASTIAGRASTAENLGMGEDARALKDSFIAAFEESDAYEPGHEGEGKGGKERDRAANAALTDYDRAKAYYWATQKKNSKTKAQEGKDYFATPEPLGQKMVQWVDARGGDKVLEPSAGHGAIARWFGENVERTVVEPSSALRSRLALVIDPANDRVVDANFEDLSINNKYDAIAMNPPFGSGGRTAIDHLAKAAQHLREGGRVAAIIPTGPAADKKFDNWLYEQNDKGQSVHGNLHMVADIKLPQSAFERAGTNVAARVVVIDKSSEAPATSTRNIDLSGAKDITEFFARLENIDLPARKVAEQPAAEVAEQEAEGQDKPNKHATTTSVQEGDVETTHTTGKGKTLRGIVRHGISKEEAQKLDAYTFKKDGGWFIRARHVGEDTAPRYSIADQTETEAFKRWFGDSKVVDADGNPLVVYHGTNKSFAAFKADGALSAAYFSNKEELASSYAQSRAKKSGGAEVTHAVYLQISNPMVVDANGSSWDDISIGGIENNSKAVGDLGKKGVSSITTNRAAELAEKHGFDGVIIKNVKDGYGYDKGAPKGSVYVAFRPEQIKSATGNTGAFDPANPNIRYSIAADVDRAQVIPAAEVTTFDVPAKDLYETANEWFRNNIQGSSVRNDALGADVGFSKAGRGKVLSVGRRDARRMSIVKALPELVKNAVLLEEVGDRKGRDGLEGYATLIAPAVVDGQPYAVSMKVRRATGRDIFYTVEAFNLENTSGGGVGPLTPTGDAHSAATLQVDGDATAVNKPGAVVAPSAGEQGGTGRESTTQQGQDRSSTSSDPQAGYSGNGDTQGAPANAPARPAGITVGELLDAVNSVNRAFSVSASPTGNIVLNDRVNGNAINAQSLRVSLEGDALGDTIAALLDNGSVVLHDTASSLPDGKHPAGVQAVTTSDGKIHLVADKLTTHTAMPVLLHEAFHVGAEKLIGTPAWNGLLKRLGQLHAQAERSSGRAREFYDAARARVAAAQRTGTLSEDMTAEEFGAYTIEHYEQAPAAFRKWVDDVIGAVKAWLLKRFGVQAGAVTPAQLRALAVAALRDGVVSQAAPRYSISEEQKAKTLADADTELSTERNERIGTIADDISFGARKVVYPRTIATTHKEFTPVYETGIAQQEARDAHIADLATGMSDYNKLTAEQKANVNKVVELGRLTAQNYTAEDLADGVANTGTKKTVRITKGGKPQVVETAIHAALTEAGEVVKLSDKEIKAYTELRAMFDKALDKFRDQTLIEFGHPELSGNPDAAKILEEQAKTSRDGDRLNNIAKFIRDIEQAKRTGYVPFTRYGDYYVTVKEKVTELSFAKDGDDAYKVSGVTPDMEADVIALGGLPEGDTYTIPAKAKEAVSRLAEKTVYSTKVETSISDMAAIRKVKQAASRGDKAGANIENIPSVKAAIDQARTEWVKGDPKRRLIAQPVIDIQTDKRVDLADVDALAQMAQLDNANWDDVRAKLATAMQARSFRKHFFNSDNVPGYSGDFERSMADYVIGMSGYLARRSYTNDWDQHIEAIKRKPELRKYAERYRDYVNSPQEEFAALRQAGFGMYIAGVPATAFANLTQVPLLTVPVLSQVAPLPLVMKELARAYKDAFAMISRKNGLDMFDPNKAPADVRDIVKNGWADGSFVPLESFDMMMTARQRNVGRRKLVKGFNDAVKVAALFFSFAERLNRLVTFIAAARLAEKPAVRKNAESRMSRNALLKQTVFGEKWGPESFAKWAVDETQYRMGKANRPEVSRGVGAAIMQFKGFMLQTLETWHRMATLHGKQGKMAMAASLLALYAFSGIWGMPGADDLRKIVEQSYKAITDKDLDLKTELRAFVARTSGSNVLAQAVTKGASYPLGVDLTRVGMGSIFPDNAMSAAGIPVDMVIGRPVRAFGKASSGDAAGAVGELSPNFIKNWAIAGGWAADGVRDKSGQRILAPESLAKSDIAMKAMGFNPSIVTDVRDYEYAQRRQETAVDQLKRKWTAEMARTLVAIERAEEGGDAKKAVSLTEDLDELFAKIDEHNAEATQEEQIKIGGTAVRNRMARERGGVMQTWGKERKQSREGAEGLRDLFGLSEEVD